MDFGAVIRVFKLFSIDLVFVHLLYHSNNFTVGDLGANTVAVIAITRDKSDWLSRFSTYIETLSQMMKIRIPKTFFFLLLLQVVRRDRSWSIQVGITRSPGPVYTCPSNLI